MRDTLIGVVVGSVVTAAIFLVLGMTSGPAPVAVLDAPAEPVVSAGSSAPGRAFDLSREVAEADDLLAENTRLRAVVETLRFKAKLQEGQLGQSGTQQIPWPPLAPAALTEAAFGADVQRMVEAVGGGEVKGMLCDEYPCIALVRADDEAAADLFFEEGQARIGSFNGLDTSVRTMSREDGSWWAMFAATESGLVPLDDSAVNHRVVLRIQDYLDTHR